MKASVRAAAGGGRAGAASRAAACLALALGLAAGGCATTAAPPPPHDPLEGFNRTVFDFNDTLDRALVKPVAQAYEAGVPELFRSMIGNVFENLSDLWIAANQLMQGKPREAASDFGRFLVNTLVGFGGIADPASEFGLEKHNEDFGQTLGRWGVPPGPYLVLPVFGPSNIRDGTGLAAGIAADPVKLFGTDSEQNAARIVRAIDNRARLLTAEKVLEGAALDRYSFLRDSYLARRRNLVWDGNPPDDEGAYDDEEDDASSVGAQPPSRVEPPANEPTTEPKR